MSYLPAEEDDYDSEDEFFTGNENYQQYLSQEMPSDRQFLQREERATVPSFVQAGQRNGFYTGGRPPTSRERRVWTPSADRGCSVAGYGGLLSVEDFHRAAGRGVLDTVERALKQGMSVDASHQSGWTALMYAASKGHTQVVEALLKHGADVHHHTDMFTALMSACNACGGTEENIGDCVKVLVKAGADVNAKDRYHMSPLMMACREGHLRAVKLLLDHGAIVNTQDSKGWTALTWATQRQRGDIVIELLDRGASPDIQHLDKLTVKDLAAYLASDEMLALLERRPIKDVDESVSSASSTKPLSEGSYCLLEGGDMKSKLTDLRYGELEVFLMGLDLGFLVPVFQQQLIDLTLLMTLTEQDLINAGVSQVGARKKLLDSIQAVHKKDWEASSLVSIHFNRQILCSDAVAMTANSSRHLRYIGSTVVYVKEHLRRHPEGIMHPTDKVSPQQLLWHTEDALKNAKTLCSQLAELQKALKNKISGHNCKPPDAIEFKKPGGKVLRRRLLRVVLLISLCVPILVLHRKGMFSELLDLPRVKSWLLIT